MISIIVPIYNVAKYLEDCLDSILMQTYLDYEVIMVNDGSTDESGEIAKKYSDKDKRFFLIEQDNRGLSGARNTALKYAKGEYICMLDSDDKFTPTFLAECMKYMDKDVDIVETGRHYITGDSFGDNNTYLEKYSDTNIIEVITSKKELFEKLGNGHIYNSVFPRVMKRELITDDFYPEGLLFEDLATTPILLDKIGKFVKINKGLFLYRVRENSITTNKFSEKSLDIFTVCDTVEEYFVKNNKKEIINDIYYLLFRNISFQYKLYMTKNHTYRWEYEKYLYKYAEYLDDYSNDFLKMCRLSKRNLYYLFKLNNIKKRILRKIKGK